MAHWNAKVKIKHLFTDAEDHASVQASMSAVADVLSHVPAFSLFDTRKFRDIPKGDDVFGPAAYANKLLDGVWDYADEHRIWIE